MNSGLPKISVAQALADRIVALKAGGLPEPTARKCEDLLIDVVGLCVTARNEDYVRSALGGCDDDGEAARNHRHQEQTTNEPELPMHRCAPRCNEVRNCLGRPNGKSTLSNGCSYSSRHSTRQIDLERYAVNVEVSPPASSASIWLREPVALPFVAGGIEDHRGVTQE